ncbi:ras association (RalGDS/AF-6) domain-containing protein [Ditylenchus destructor]|uniref:Ras association (RalGDS/AF-6) domain-containing protein n=1 Tax=Ditylenchus destructor TaxID=166010 RepID=A0AAD4MLZ1_9BILA|nr:ras association (RalGDS/AF-6) domain-containing protein [Ditylenchus destructor]
MVIKASSSWTSCNTNLDIQIPVTSLEFILCVKFLTIRPSSAHSRSQCHSVSGRDGKSPSPAPTIDDSASHNSATSGSIASTSSLISPPELQLSALLIPSGNENNKVITSDESQHRTIISIGEEEEPTRVKSKASSSAGDFSWRSSFASNTTTSSSLTSRNIPHSRGRSSSLSNSSLSSMDSFERDSQTADLGPDDWGYLRVFTCGIKSDTDYKTLKITSRTTSQAVVEMILNKFRLSFRDLNLFQLWMEIRTRHNGEEVKSILELDKNSRPLELQRCHPPEMSRFILSMVSNAILARIYDSDICPQSNYKSVLISRRTTCSEALRLVLQMCRIQTSKSGTLEPVREFTSANTFLDFRLFVVEGDSEAEIPSDCFIAGVYLSLMPNQRIVLRKVVVRMGQEMA